jgi:hypothetical protein
MAWSAQHPAEPAEVAPTFLGGLGTGKGTLGNALCRIFYPHAQHASSPDHLTGKFNEHLRQCCFLFADECYGPKDKHAEGALKRLITEPTLSIEPKGRGRIEVPNRLKIVLASNHDWVIPAGEHERRYVVQKVAETYQQDREWFEPIYQEMNSGGLEAMLFDLLDYNLGDWHPRQIVRTAALTKQQEQSLPPLDEWWVELLQTGVLQGATSRQPNRPVSNQYEAEITETDGFGGQRKRTVRRDCLYDQARRISPRLKSVSDHILGGYLSERGCKRVSPYRDGDNRRGWEFPSLEQCRKEWEKRYPDTKWSNLEVKAWRAGE